MANCETYDSCIAQNRDQLRHPMDTRSLYRNRIYDNQTANKRCYEGNPINIVEGFGAGGLSLNKLLRWGIVILLVYLVVMMFVDARGTTTTGFGQPTFGAMTQTSPMEGMVGGLSESLSDLSFLRTE